MNETTKKRKLEHWQIISVLLMAYDEKKVMADISHDRKE